MYRASSSVRVCSLAILAGVAWLDAMPRAADGAGAFATPRHVWDSYQQALADKHFGRAFESLTPGAQEEHLERCILGGLMLAEETHGAPDAPKEFERLRDRLREVMRSHGIDPRRVAEAFEAAHRKASEADVDLSEERSRQLLLNYLKGDRKKFFQDAMSAISEFQRLIAAKDGEAPAAAESRCGGGAGEPGAEVLGVRLRGDRAFMVIRRRLPEGSVLMHGSLRIRYTTETHYFRRIDGRWFLASENNEPVQAPLHVIKESNLPYSCEFEMDCGDAMRFGLPSGKELAVWCSGTPFIGQALGEGMLTISYGEKPFRSAPLKYRKLREGERVVAGEDSYIRMGGVTTGSNRPGWCQRDLYIGDYRILLEENAGKEGTLLLKVQVRVATPSERLHGDAEREHYIKQLTSASPAEQRAAIEKLHEMVSIGSIRGSESDKIAGAIRPLLKHSDAAVSNAAFGALCSLGDEQTLLSLMTPAPKAPYRSVDGGRQIAEWNLNQKHESVKRRAATFFESKDQVLVAFAVGYFARVEDPIAKKQMLAALEHESVEVRAEVVGSLRFYCEYPEAGRLVETKLDDKAEKVVLEALRAAYWLSQHVKTERITPHLKHPSPAVREMACYALQDCRDPAAVGPLLEATRDKEPRVRGKAAATLGRIGTLRGVDRLIEMLQDAAADVRADAIDGLRSLDSPKTIAAFKRLLETEKDERVRQMVEETLQQR
jgi:HEAT repeat protein